MIPDNKVTARAMKLLIDSTANDWVLGEDGVTVKGLRSTAEGCSGDTQFNYDVDAKFISEARDVILQLCGLISHDDKTIEFLKDAQHENKVRVIKLEALLSATIRTLSSLGHEKLAKGFEDAVDLV